MNTGKVAKEIIRLQKFPNRLIVDESSVFVMNPANMEELQLFRGDTILIEVFFSCRRI